MAPHELHHHPFHFLPAAHARYFGRNYRRQKFASFCFFFLLGRDDSGFFFGAFRSRFLSFFVVGVSCDGMASVCVRDSEYEWLLCVCETVSMCVLRWNGFSLCV